MQMKHYFRLCFLFLCRYWRPRIDFLDKSILSLRVWPTDIDLLIHMNNGVYLSLMDLGRMDLTLRSGFYEVLTRNKIYPVLASEAIRFRKSLKPFQSFEIQTELLSWDEKYFFLKQQFVSHDELYASAIVKARFLRKSGGKVDPDEIFRLLKISEEKLNAQLKKLDALEDYKNLESHLN